MNVTVFIPTHCSALLSLSQHAQSHHENYNTKALAQFQQTFENDDEPADEDAAVHDDVHVLYIQCHLDRIVWNFFQPLLGCEGNTESAIHAIQILLWTFRSSIRRIRRRRSISSHGVHIVNETSHNDKAGALIEESEHCITWTQSFCNFLTCAGNEADRRTRQGSSSINITVILLPPYRYPTAYHPNPRHSNLYTEHLFASALVQQENLNIRLQTLNAFVATMGGGYFLCRFLSTAVRLAQYQRQIAIALDDVQLAMKCNINEAYNYIYAGKIDIAKAFIQVTEREAETRGDDLIVGMCQSATWFATKVEETALKEMELDDGRQATNDDFLRIRIQRNRSILESNVGTSDGRMKAKGTKD
eukprot:scaffold4826_cov274-Chaetoceros_neogracile.AAC.3